MGQREFSKVVAVMHKHTFQTNSVQLPFYSDLLNSAASTISGCVSGLPYVKYKFSNNEIENVLAQVKRLPMTFRSHVHVTQSLADGQDQYNYMPYMPYTSF